MRRAWLSQDVALAERFAKPTQLPPEAPAGALPAYLESFLAHLRLLVGVPFPYLVPDARLLPPESIRFFYLDRSWTDRLVDGAFAVGKIGTREQAHHQAQHRGTQQRLDRTERVVRSLQRGKLAFTAAATTVDGDVRPAEITTGFVLRSQVVADWPHMEVRAYRRGAGDALEQLPTLRLERLGPAVLLALFEGIPDRVDCEEPHHGVQLGVFGRGTGGYQLAVRRPHGEAIAGAPFVQVPVRQSNPHVIAVAELRRRLQERHVNDTRIVPQTGSAALAIALLAPPWRQRFEGRGGPRRPGVGDFAPVVAIAARVHDPDVRTAVEELER